MPLVPYNKLLTNLEMARAILGNIGPWLFSCGAWSVLQRLKANIPQYSPHAWLVPGYYLYLKLTLLVFNPKHMDYQHQIL